MKFTKTIIPCVLVGNGLLRAIAPLWLFSISYPTRAHGIIAIIYYMEGSAEVTPSVLIDSKLIGVLPKTLYKM